MFQLGRMFQPAHMLFTAGRAESMRLQPKCLCACSGEANGTAYVQFETAAMAKDAHERYNNVALDGKPMKIAFDKGSERVLSSGLR